MTNGDTAFCKLTGKRVIIQKIIYHHNDDPMFIEPEKKIEKYLVRYWSKVQDKFFSHTIFPDELQDKKPVFDFSSSNLLKEK